MDGGLATNNDSDAVRNNMTNGLILKNVELMNRQARLINNAIRLPSTTIWQKVHLAMMKYLQKF
jgi:hypothetical protein